MRLKICALLITLLLLPAALSAQFYFGKNKVQYSPFKWKVLATTHFKVYFYDQENQIAQIAAAAAEESYEHHADIFNFHIFRKIPLIIYSAPTFFAQTNVTPGILPENVAGFTEFFKGRMVVPFNGSIGDFRRVIRHELVHTFMYDKIIGNLSEHRRTSYYGPPLWFTEGIAEYWSREWEPESEMILADMTLENNIRNIEDLDNLTGTFFMYKFGESFCHYVADHYGEDKISMMFDNWWKAKSFDELFRITVGHTLAEVGDDWVYYLKKKHFPKIEQGDLPSKVAKPLTEHQFAVKPAALNITYKGASDWIAYKANNLGYSGIYMHSPSTHQTVTLVKGERSPAFESLHLLQSKIAASGDGKIAFTSKRFERDVIYIYDVLENQVVNTLEFQKLYQISSPSWSNDGKYLVFSAATYSGIYDIYKYTLADASLTRITNDIYLDADPAFDNSGNIIFASDRGSFGYDAFMNLFRFSSTDSIITPITFGRYNDRSPFFVPDGMLFSSDREGSSNIYLMKPDGGTFRITNYATGAFDPVMRDSSLIFTGFQNFDFSIYSQTVDSSIYVRVERPPIQFTAWNPDYLAGNQEEGVLDYTNEYSFDVAQSAISYDAVFGSIGGFQTVFSDMLGNKLYYVLISNSATSKDDLIKSFNVGITYVNKEHRLNYGYGAFHLYDEHYDDYDGFTTERQTGLEGLVSYPLSKFTRVETSAFVRHSYKDFTLFDRSRNAVLSTNYISLVHDNSLWDVSGPIDGVRYNTTVGLTTDFYSGKFFNRLAFVDLRNYLRIRKYSAFATRAFGFVSAGSEPYRIYLGGSWSMRGYDRRAFYARKVLFLSNELRFPLIDNLFIGFPFGRIGFQAIRGALFFDTGSAWNDEFDRFVGSFGAGARVALGYLAVLRFDLSKRTDFQSIEPGLKFDFFFGWNF